MAADLSPRLSRTRAPGRRFGLEIGTVAAIAAALLFRKHHATLGLTCLALSVFLIGVAVVRPAVLDVVAGPWLTFGAALARITTPIVLALLYFAIVTPMAFLRRTLGTSPLARDRHANSYWITPTARTAEERRARMERQF